MPQRKSTYQGTQYRGGREKGRKNLVKVDGGYMVGKDPNHLFFVSQEEKKALETAVNTANRKRARMLKAEGALPRKSRNQDTGDTVASLHLMGKESDFILAPKSKSLQQFRDRASFENYLSNVRNVNRREYVNERTEQYRENYMTALNNAFGDEASDIKAALKKMTPKQYREFVASRDDVMEIGYIYQESKRTEKLNSIREAMGLETKPIPDDDEVLSLKRRATRGRKN